MTRLRCAVSETDLDRDVLRELWEVQDVFGFLPKREILRVSEELDLPLPDVYAVARSEAGLKLEPMITHGVRVCFGSPWHACASPEVVAAFKRELASGSRTGVPRFVLETSKCPGPCSGRPHVFVDGRKVTCKDASDVSRIVRELNL